MTSAWASGLKKQRDGLRLNESGSLLVSDRREVVNKDGQGRERHQKCKECRWDEVSLSMESVVEAEAVQVVLRCRRHHLEDLH